MLTPSPSSPTPTRSRPTRRAACLKILAACAVAAGGIVTTVAAVPGCNKTDASGDKKSITVGFVYVGSKQDYGYNQSHAEGAAAVKKIPGVKIVEQENVPETIEVEKAMESMIKLDGATVVTIPAAATAQAARSFRHAARRVGRTRVDVGDEGELVDMVCLFRC